MAQAGNNWFTPTTNNLPDKLVANHVYKDIDVSLKNTTTGGKRADIKISGMTVPKGFVNKNNAGIACDGLMPAIGNSCPLFVQEDFSPNKTTATSQDWSFKVQITGITGVTKTITRPLEDYGIYATRVTTLSSNVNENNPEFVEYLYTNNSPSATQAIVLSLPTTPGLILHTTCGATLGPKSTCMVDGIYTPPAVTQKTFVSYSIGLKYGNQLNVPIEDHATISPVDLIGKVITDLPPNLSESVPAPVVYQLQNESAGDVTDLAVTLPTIDGVIWNKNNCDTTLKGDGGVCTVSGTFTPTAAQVGKTISIPVKATYSQGEAVRLNTATEVEDIALTGSVSTALQPNVAEGVSQPIAFSINNNSKAAATGVSIFYPDNIAGLVLHNHCEASIPAHSTCLVTGTYTPPISKTATDEQEQRQAIVLTISYDQGAPFDLITSTRIDQIALSGAWTKKLPPNLAEGHSANFVYTITNGDKGEATGIKVTPPVVAGLSNYTNSCGTSQPASGVCTISGTYTAPISKSTQKSLTSNDSYRIGIPVSLSYDQGANVASQTLTTVTAITLNGVVSTGLDDNIAEGETVPFAFTITAGDHGPATGITETLHGTTGVTFTHHCPTTLAANDSCTISGTYTAPATDEGEPAEVSASVAYDQGSPVSLETTGTVHAIALSAVATTQLQANMAEGSTQTFTYTITNHSTASAQGSQAMNITVTHGDIEGLEVNNHCSNLAANRSCTIDGVYTAPATENEHNVTINLGVHYDQGSDINLSATTLVTPYVLTNDPSRMVVLPPNMGVGDAAPFKFVLENTSASGSITNVHVAQPSIAGVSNWSSTCTGTLNHGHTCAIEGTFTAQASQENTAVHIPLTVSYDHGNDIYLSASTTVDDIVVSGEVETPLEDEVEAGKSYNIAFRFTKSADSGTATGVNMVLPTGIAGLTLTNGCTATTMAPGDHCVVSGTYVPPTGDQNVSVSVTLNYDQGDSVTLESHTHVKGEPLLTTTTPSDLKFAPGETTEISITNDGTSPAMLVGINLPGVIEHNLETAVPTCDPVLTTGATCTLALQMKSDFTTTGDLGAITVQENNSSHQPSVALSFNSEGVSTLVTAPSVSMAQPDTSYTLTITNDGDSALSGVSIPITSLPSTISRVSTTCTGEIGAHGFCNDVFTATNEAHGTTALTVHYTVGGVDKTLATSLIVPNTTVAITNSGGDTGEDIHATVTGGEFTITNTGPYAWQPPTGSTNLSVTRDEADSSWLTLRAGSSDNCLAMTSLLPTHSCQVGYDPITVAHDLSAVITAHGANIADTSQNLEPQEYVSIGIDGDDAAQHLTYRAVIVTNLTTHDAEITGQDIAPPSSMTHVIACDPVGTTSPNCPTKFESTCFAGPPGKTLAAGEQCQYWYKANTADALSADASESTPTDSYWVDITANGTTQKHTRAVDFTYGNDLYVGGIFASAGHVDHSASLAYWDGANWHALGDHLNNEINDIYALTLYQGDLAIGGGFTDLADESDADYLAQWNGQAISAIGGGGTGNVYALTAIGDKLYVGGAFTDLDGNNYIAAWDGGAWSSVGSGLNYTVVALTSVGDKLYVGGAFTETGDEQPVSKIAAWDSVNDTWADLGSQLGDNKYSSTIYALQVIGNDLYVGGQFSEAGGQMGANNIAKLDLATDPDTWSSLVSLDIGVYALAEFQNHLYAGGFFTDASGVSAADKIAMWGGTAWSALDTGLNGTVDALAPTGDALYVAGIFDDVAGVSGNDSIAEWRAGSWHTLGDGLQGVSLPRERTAEGETLLVAPHINLQ